MARLPGYRNGQNGYANDDTWDENWNEFQGAMQQHAAPAPAPAPEPDPAAAARDEVRQRVGQVAQAVGQALQPATAEPAAPDPISEWEQLRQRRRSQLDELDALGDQDEYGSFMQRHRQGRSGQSTTEAPEPLVGVSPLARQLEQEGFFAQQAAEHAARREQETQRALEESQGWSVGSIANAARNFLGGIGRLTPEEAREAGIGRTGSYNPFRQSELETAEWSAPFWRRMAEVLPNTYDESDVMARVAAARALLASGDIAGAAQVSNSLPPGFAAGTALRSLLQSHAGSEERRLGTAQAMERGEAPLPNKAWWRNQAEIGARTVAQSFTSSFIQLAGIYGGHIMEGLGGGDAADNRVYKFGHEVEEYLKKLFPGDPARQHAFSTALAQGLASTAAFGGQGMLVKLMGAGQTGVLATIGLSGAAMQVPDEFARVTEAMRKGTATEQDRLMVTLANSVGGVSELLPFAPTFAGVGRRGVGGTLARMGEQAVEEGLFQEPLQQMITNEARRQTYDPTQDPMENVLQGMMVGFVSGAAGAGVLSPLQTNAETRAAGARGRVEPGTAPSGLNFTGPARAAAAAPSGPGIFETDSWPVAEARARAANVREARARTGTQAGPAQQPTPAPEEQPAPRTPDGYPVHPALVPYLPVPQQAAPQGEDTDIDISHLRAAPGTQGVGDLAAVANVMGACVSIGARRPRRRKRR